MVAEWQRERTNVFSLDSELLEGKNWPACPPGAWLSAFYGEDEDQLEKCVQSVPTIPNGVPATSFNS